LYAGAGLAATAGLPVWRQFAEQLVQSAERAELIKRADVEFYESALRDRKADYVVDEIVGHIPNDFLLTFLRGLFLGMRDVPEVYRDLSALPFAAVLTTNFDNFAERAFGYAPEKVRSLRDTELMRTALTRSESFLLHLYGTLDRPETVLVSPAQFDEAVSSNLQFRELVESLFLSKTILFAGCSLEGIETYLRGLRFHGRSNTRHFAIAGVLGTSWEAMGGVLERRHGIQVIPYEEGSADGLRAAIRFLRVACGIDDAGPVEHPTRAAASSTSPLTRVILDNIGPFDKLDCTLKPDLNVFLGNNGVGKSTILRAIAVALAGRAAEPYAGRLVRTTR